jgi:hypothetical protein
MIVPSIVPLSWPKKFFTASSNNVLAVPLKVKDPVAPAKRPGIKFFSGGDFFLFPLL